MVSEKSRRRIPCPWQGYALGCHFDRGLPCPLKGTPCKIPEEWVKS